MWHFISLVYLFSIRKAKQTSLQYIFEYKCLLWWLSFNRIAIRHTYSLCRAHQRTLYISWPYSSWIFLITGSNTCSKVGQFDYSWIHLRRWALCLSHLTVIFMIWQLSPWRFIFLAVYWKFFCITVQTEQN